MAQPFNCLTVNNRVFFNTFLQLHPGVIKVIFFKLNTILFEYILAV